MSDAPLPPFAVLVRHQVADYDAWKAVFDGDEEARRAIGFLGHHINRAEDDPNLISLYMALTDLEQAKAMAADDRIKDLMQSAGVISAPEFTWMTPAREAIAWDRGFPAFILSHRVADFDAWLAAYNEVDDLRLSRGIVGHAANRSLDDPSVAMVYHQAETFDALRAFLADDELKTAMKAAGVVSEPEVSFQNGGSAKLY